MAERKPVVLVGGQLKELPAVDTLPPQAPAAHSHATSDVTGLDAALSGKEPAISEGTTAQYWRGDKTWQTLNKSAVGLGNVDNTSDSTKAVLSAAKLTTARTIGGVSFDGSANINLPGVNAAGNQNTTGNAATATKLATARTINGVSFDGTANITVADATKEPAITAGTTAQYRRGDKTWRDFATDVRGAILTGLSTATNAAITATDTVLAALGKLQKQFSDHFASTANAHPASAIDVAAASPPTSYSIPAGTVQALLAQNWQDVGGLMDWQSFHTSGAGTQHPASTISNTPAGGISATTVQAAINELDTEKFGKTGGMVNAASATTPSSRGVVTVFANFGDGLSGSNFAAVALGSAQGQKAGYSLWPTFTGTGDNGPRRAADIWASFNGIWGTEKLSLGVGREGWPNDANAVTVEKLAISSGNGASTALFVNNTTFGYGAGAGGTATQTGSRTSGVILNKPSGQITLVSAAGTTAWQSFTVTNSVVESTDTPIVAQVSGTDLYEIHVTAVATGSFRLSFRTTGGTTPEQPVFKFEIHKGATS